MPEMTNVLKGDMSLVEPRPLLMQCLDRYSLEQIRRHEAKSGSGSKVRGLETGCENMHHRFLY